MIIRIGKVKVKFDYISIAFLALCSIVFSERFTACVLCAAIHEAGHAVTLLHFGCDSLELRLRLLCVDMMDNGRTKRSPAEHALCILAGPLMNFLCIPLFWLLFDRFDKAIFMQCAQSSAALGIFNMLPFVSTDGGELLEMLLMKLMPPQRAQRIVEIITAAVIAAAAAAVAITMLNRISLGL